VEGHLLADGTRVADHIILLRRAPGNRFSFTGTVSAIGDNEWTISGRAVRLNPDTAILGSIKTGDAAIVQIKPTKPMVIENVKELPQLGRFAIRDMGSTIAAGMCIAIQAKQMR
jgi:hypothetical protein